MIRYILDTNILITAYRRTYPMDVIPTFWDKLLEKAIDKTFAIIDFVKDEIDKGEDELQKWIESNIDQFKFLDSSDDNVISAYQTIIDSVNSNSQFTVTAKSNFAEVADSWLIAHALAYGYIIVTEETFNKETKSKVRIPNICIEFDVEYVNTIDFLRKVGIRI